MLFRSPVVPLQTLAAAPGFPGNALGLRVSAGRVTGEVQRLSPDGRQLWLVNERNGAALPTAAGASTAVFTNRAGRSSVLSVGPQNAFVVVNFGSARGAQLGHRLTISQGNAVVATAVISDVRANFSVAQVQPESLRGVLQKGDSAVLIR